MEATAKLGGVLDYINAAIAWLKERNLPVLFEKAVALAKAIREALANDGKISLGEWMVLIPMFFDLVGELHLAGFKLEA